MQKISKKSIKKAQDYVNILGVNIISTSKESMLNQIQNKLESKEKFAIFTSNPELVLMASRDNDLRSIVNSATYSVPDGVGLNYAAKFLYGKSLNIIPARKLFMDLIGIASVKGSRVFLLGGQDNEADLAARHFISLYPNIFISSSSGPYLDNFGNPVSKVDIKLQNDIVKKINDFNPDLLFVAFGNPKQEYWIYNNLSQLKIGGAMTVGGTFRYLAGMSKVPPQWMANRGLEWLWRLLTEPKRVFRVMNAVLLFPIKVIRQKFLVFLKFGP